MRQLVTALTKNYETLYRIAMILLTAGLYYLQANFIPRKEFLQEKEGALKQYQEDKRLWWDKLNEVNAALNNLDVSLRLFQVNKGIIEDHESRIRTLERDINSLPAWRRNQSQNNINNASPNAAKPNP